MSRTIDPSDKTNTRRPVWVAFGIGALVHLGLLGLSLSGLFDFATFLLLIFALPGALVDISTEMIHPGQTGSILLVTIASVLNGLAYAFGTWCLQIILRKRRARMTDTIANSKTSPQRR